MAKRSKPFDKLPHQNHDGRPPCYVPGKTGFYCPLSPNIAWYWGLVYKECPLDSMERDMEECVSCQLRGDALPSRKPRRKKPRRRKDAGRGSHNRKNTEQGA